MMPARTTTETTCERAARLCRERRLAAGPLPITSAWEQAHGATSHLDRYDESGERDGTTDDEDEIE